MRYIPQGEKPIDKNMLKANIQLQDECRELKDIIKRAKKYASTSPTVSSKTLLRILSGKVE